MAIVKYIHHGKEVSVQEEHKGKHREYCLCHNGCKKFLPDGNGTNCKIAYAVFKNCVEFGIVTPVWECPNYVSDKEI